MKQRQRLFRLGAFVLALAFSTNLQAGKGGNGGGGGKPGGGGGGDGGGGGGDTSVPCITFDDLEADTLGSDIGESYCDVPKDNVLVSFSQDGHLSLDTEVTKKGGAQHLRGLWCAH